MIGYVASDNTAIRMDKPVVIFPWTGDLTRGGFYTRDGKDLIYVDRRTGKVFIATNLDLSRDWEYIDTLFNQPDNDWHTDPDTGNRILYRYLEPVEWVFG